MIFSIAKLNRLPKEERNSTPFRRKGMEKTVRGRSWAIHDGIFLEVFDEEWESPKMYRMPGKDFKVTTFPDQVY